MYITTWKHHPLPYPIISFISKPYIYIALSQNVPDVVECSWDVINTQVLLSVRAGELKVEEDEVPLQVAYPGNRDNEYEFRCQKQRIDVTWSFEG